MPKQLFASHADTTIDRVRETYAERGEQYGDTWGLAPFLALKATLRRAGIVFEERDLRSIAAAVLVDIKYARLIGGYKDDSIIDGIAYSALWAEEMKQSRPSIPADAVLKNVCNLDAQCVKCGAALIGKDFKKVPVVSELYCDKCF